jgi:hypothetical protein
MKKVILCFFFSFVLLMGCQNSGTPKLQDGDIIFHTSTSSQSKAIQAATHSKYSHMGIIYHMDNGIYVFEAVQPVKLTPLKDWIKRGKGQHYVVKRLKNAEKILTPAVIKKLKEEGYKYLGKDYDLYFEWSDERIYCSELVWKIYKNVLDIELGKLQRIKDFDLSHPEVKAKMKERYGDNIPFEELVISQDRIFKSDLLKTVVQK